MNNDNDNEHEDPAGPSGADAQGEDFTTSEGLRAVLDRLHRAGAHAWEHDPTAAKLMVFAAEKYAALARKHGLDPWEAASAAFDVMRTRAARRAAEPWAVITHAVRITCIAEERGQGLLCSVHQARRPHISQYHDPERFSDRENPLTDYHAAFQIADPTADDDTDDERQEAVAEACTSAFAAVEETIRFLTLLRWPEPTARIAVDHVCGVLAKTGSRQATVEALRRDKESRALLDLPGRSWTSLLRVLLGDSRPGFAATVSGRGVLLRLLLGESVRSLLRDEDLVLAVALAAPGGPTRGGRR